jgi:hypothetical protein
MKKITLLLSILSLVIFLTNCDSTTEKKKGNPHRYNRHYQSTKKSLGSRAGNGDENQSCIGQVPGNSHTG